MAEKKALRKRGRQTASSSEAAVSTPEPQENAKPASFPIVGVGASAGGLEAFTQLLSALPDDLGMAFVCVPHLDPNRESAMTELLGHETIMPVLKVEHGMRVKPNHVYVIPPNTELTISNGVLNLSTRKRGEMSMPIDIFFRSLAEDQRSNAVAVVLSGTASDGSVGAAAVKSEGGITFAQDSKSAKYDGMPSSAVATGCIDFVLPPAAIAAELTRLREHPYIANHEVAATGPELSQDHDLGHLFRLIRQVTKVDFSDYKPATVRRRILRRMALKKIEDFGEYVAYVREHRGEAEALYQDILINVTSFFRNPDAFEALKEVAFPVLFKNRAPSDPIRVWVPGCSTGEEAYSHAVCLMEYVTATRAEASFQVFGTDLSETAVWKARTGIYKESISADVSPTRLRRFFTKVEEGYQISKSVRDACIFARQNAFSDPPFSKMDIVSCRNLLIYLGPALQRRVIPIFHYALKAGGYLMVGNTEGLLGAGADLFEIADKKNRIYLKKAMPSPISFGFTSDHLESSARPTFLHESGAQAETVKMPENVQKEADRLLLAKYAPAAVVVNEQLDILQTRGHTAKFLELPVGKASLNLLRMARPGLLFELQKAIDESRRTGSPAVRKRLEMEDHSKVQPVTLEVTPFRTGSDGTPMYLITFAEAGLPDGAKSATETPKAAKKPAKAEDESLKRQINQLKQELAATKEYLQSIIEEREATNEELQSANEEIQSANEELQSTNEELQTSKEELESANEELNTVNDEMQHRNQQLSLLSNDLTNLLNSVNMAIVMVGPDLRVRRFTLQAEKMLGLSSVDVGRPLSTVKFKLDLHDLEQKSLDVIRDIVAQQLPVTDENGKKRVMRIIPYRTSDNKIEGVVLTIPEGEIQEPAPLGTRRLI